MLFWSERKLRPNDRAPPFGTLWSAASHLSSTTSLERNPSSYGLRRSADPERLLSGTRGATRIVLPRCIGTRDMPSSQTCWSRHTELTTLSACRGHVSSLPTPQGSPRPERVSPRLLSDHRNVARRACSNSSAVSGVCWYSAKIVSAAIARFASSTTLTRPALTTSNGK
jgi:hypothetical protein